MITESTSKTLRPKREVDTPGWVAAGHISRAHGVHGSMRVVLDVNFAELLKQPTTLQIKRRNHSAPQPAVVKEWRVIHRALLLSLDPPLTREEAMAFAGAVVLIPENCLAPPSHDEYYFYELIGAELVDALGKHLGRVDDLLDNRGQALLSLTDASGKPQLLPLVPALCKHYDREAKRLTVDVPEELWE